LGEEVSEDQDPQTGDTPQLGVVGEKASAVIDLRRRRMDRVRKTQPMPRTNLAGSNQHLAGDGHHREYRGVAQQPFVGYAQFVLVFKNWLDQNLGQRKL